jgi:hypothetical protein
MLLVACMKTTILMGALALALGVSATAAAEETTVTTKKTTVKHQREPVGTTRTTAAYYGGPRDVGENRADERRVLEGRHLTIAPMLGYGSNGLGVGVGGRIGYTFDTPVYLGGNVMYQAGDRGSAAVWYPSAEVGYDIGVSSVLFRPYGGVGALLRSANETSTGLVYPGMTVHWLIPRSAAFLGGDARVLVPFDANPGFAMAFTTGLNL